MSVRGVWVSWDLRDWKRITRESAGFFQANLEVGTYDTERSKGKALFVSNATVRAVIQKKAFLDGMPLGHIRFFFDRFSKEVITSNYQPYRFAPGFRKTGLASFAELRIKEMLAKQFPDWYCRSTINPSQQRMIQLGKSGRERRKSIPIREEIRLLKRYVSTSVRSNRNMRSQSGWKKLAGKIRARASTLRRQTKK